MSKIIFKSNAKVEKIFEDLEQFLRFCQNHGYKFYETDLYNWKSYAYQQFNKFQQGKIAKDMWLQDARR